MGVNGAGTIRRSPGDQEADIQEKFDNWLAESWKDWPNEAQFEGLEEHRGPIEFPVKGIIPSWAAGSLYRIGPGESTVDGTPKGTHSIHHWFDGTAHTHKFDIIPGDTDDAPARVVYSSRRQAEEIVAVIRERGWLPAQSFGQRVDPCVGVFAKVMSVFEPTRSNNNVALIPDMPGMPSVGGHDKHDDDNGQEVQGDKNQDKGKDKAGRRSKGNKDKSKRSKDKESKPGKQSRDRDTPSFTGHRSGASNLIATTDSAFLQKLDPDTLQPIGHTNQTALHPELTGQISCAHARFDPVTGDLFNFNLEIGGRFATYRVFRVNAATQKTDILATFSGAKYLPTYIHSFFLTQNHVVLCLPTAHFAWAGLKIVWQKNFIDAIKPFDEASPCRWLVVDRRHGRGVVAEFTTPAKFFFHSVNSFEQAVEREEEEGVVEEDGDKITKDDDKDGASGGKAVDLLLDVVQYDNTDIMHTFYYDMLLDRNDAVKKAMIDKQWYRKTQCSLVRYRYRLQPPSPSPPSPSSSSSPSSPSSSPSSTSPSSFPPSSSSSSSSAEQVFRIESPHCGELPTTNPSTACKPYRYVWAVCNRGLSTFMDGIVKTDLHTREALLWSGPRAHSPGEPIFVARPGAQDEDDGVILSLVLDGLQGSSYLLCLDAHTMEELGRAEAAFAIAIGLHGAFRRR